MEKKYPAKPYSEKWEESANALARDFAPSIYACQKCGAPVASGYRCGYCGDSNPSATPEEELEFQEKCDNVMRSR